MVVIDSEIDAQAVPPLIQGIAKAWQEQPQPAGQPPDQETFMMRDHIPTEFLDIAANF